MSWIDDDNDELRRQQESVAELSARNQKIAERAEKIYNDLWAEIVNRINEAKSKGVETARNLTTNGDVFEREIRLGKASGHAIIIPRYDPTVPHTMPDRVNINLAKDHLGIVVSGLQSEALHFRLDLGDDDVVQIKYKGEQKQIQDAAALILRPILYPTLYKAPQS